MRFYKRSIAVVISVLLVCAMVSTAFAMSTINTAKISITDKTAAAGEVVQMDVSIKDNPGILGAILTLSYDQDLTLVDAREGLAFSALTLTKPGVLASPCNFTWDALDINPSDIKDGTILSLFFRLPSDAKTGDKYSVNLSYEDGNVIDSNLDSVNLSIDNAKITVGDSVSSVTSVSLDSATAFPGDRIEISANIANNPGVLGAIMTLTYDEGLTLVEARNGSAFDVLSLTLPGIYQSPCNFTWDALDLSSSDIKDGVILTLVFEVNDSLEEGTVCNVSLSYDDDNVIDYNLNSVSLQMNSGQITIESAECKHDYIENVTQPTCTTDGYIDYICSKCGDMFTIYPDDLKAQHLYVAIEEIDPDCENDGLYIYQCLLCDDVFIEEPLALGHDIVVQEAVAATCTESGLTQGSYCARCNTVFETQQTIPATGHDNQVYRVTVTCEKSGYIIYKCSNCAKLETVKTDALGHDISFVKFENNTLVYTCTACGTEVRKTPSEVKAIWGVEHINTTPVRGNINQYLNLVDDGVINAKDYYLINNYYQEMK